MWYDMSFWLNEPPSSIREHVSDGIRSKEKKTCYSLDPAYEHAINGNVNNFQARFSGFPHMVINKRGKIEFFDAKSIPICLQQLRKTCYVALYFAQAKRNLPGSDFPMLNETAVRTFSAVFNKQ